jgi:hypothetical protein
MDLHGTSLERCRWWELIHELIKKTIVRLGRSSPGRAGGREEMRLCVEAWLNPFAEEERA